MKNSESAPGDAPGPPEMRVLLLGNKASGKSSSIGTILGREEPSPHTAQCVKSQGEAEGTSLTVIEAPGWWRNYRVEDSPNLNAQEIVFSASLCPPGPHAVLLVVRLDTGFTATCRRALEERLGLFQSEHVWSHSMVLFTFGDHLEGTTIEEHIEGQGEALQGLVEKCGNRVHVLNNKDRKDSRQVKELLEKIEAMVTGNGGRHFEVEYTFIHELGVRRRAEETRAVERRTRVQRQDQAFACLAAQTQRELRILLVGHRHSGKSSAGNFILGREEFELRRTSKCVIKGGEIAGRAVTVVEAPGWWNNFHLKNTPELSKLELLGSASLCPPGPHVLLLVVRVDGSFTARHRKVAEEHLELFGEKVWEYTVVLFTYGDWLGETRVEQHIESEGDSLRRLVDRCGNRYHVFRNDSRNDGSQVVELLQKVDETVGRNGGRHYEVDRASSEDVQTRQKAAEERAKSRKSEVMEKRRRFGLRMGEVRPPSELRIVMCGSMYSGKTSTGNTILGGGDLGSTSNSECVMRRGQVGTRQIVLVEVPGWLRCSYAGLSLQQDLLRAVTMCAPGPHAVLLVIQADASFTMNEKRNLREHLRLLDERIWNHAMVLFTCGDWLGDWSIEEHIESEGEALQWLVETCGNRYHVLNNKGTGDSMQVTELLDKIEEMVVGNGGYLLMHVPKPPLAKIKKKHEDVQADRMASGQHDEDEQGQGGSDGRDQEKEAADAVAMEEGVATATDETKSWIHSHMHIHKARSMQHSQPTMGGDDRSDASSGYASEASPQVSSTGTMYRSLMSLASSISSGFSYLRGGLSVMNVFTKRPRLEEDSAEIQENRKQYGK